MTKLKEQTRWRVKNDDKGYPAITGKRGIIHEYGSDELDVWILNTHIVPRIERAGWVARNHYDDGALFIRPFSDLDKACGYIKAPKRRHMSEEQRKACAERLAGFKRSKK